MEAQKPMIEALLGINITTLVLLLTVAFRAGEMVNAIKSLTRRVRVLEKIAGIPDISEGEII